MSLFRDLVRAVLVVCLACMVIDAVAMAQTSRDRRKEEDAPNPRVLEERIQKAEAALVDEYKDVVQQIYNAGDREAAIAMLKRLKQLSPELEGVDEHIKTISEELMSENSDEVDIDTRKGSWEPVGDVMEGKPFRLKASGEYKLTMTATLGVNGLVADEKAKDHVSDAALGCLLGVIVEGGKPGKPFAINAELEQTPKKSGRLFVKLNVPEGAKCVGKLKVEFSGYIMKIGK
ncbi:MAG: hypothetical protein R3C49_02155 [Planctomycetaceae bacterium]